MRKISFFLTLVLLSITLVYIVLPQEVFADINIQFWSKASPAARTARVKEILGQISSYAENRPMLLEEKEVEAEEVREEETLSDKSKERDEKEKEDPEFEVVENKDEIVAPEPENAVSGSEEEYILAEINKYRAENGLAAVSMNSEVCEFAATRAKELASNYSHDGFRDRIENKTLPYSSYSKVTENIAENYSYTDVVNGWRNSSGHAENMRADTPFVCVKRSGNHHAYEGWRP